MSEEKKNNKVKAGDSNLMAALSYISILSVILYITKKDDQYIQFHSKQGIVIFALSVIGLFPVLGWPIMVIAIVLMVVGATKAYVGEKYEMPIISGFASKVNF